MADEVLTRVENRPTVFVVDDDPAVRESLSFLMGSVGIRVETFANAQAFLDGYSDAREGCLILDVRMSGMSGLELQEKLQSLGSRLPIIVVTGYGDVAMAVRALKRGALDFIEKPFTDQELLERINGALDVDQRNRNRDAMCREVEERIGHLTRRERQVMDLVVAGKANKAIAHELDLSPKTVEVHRARMMEKMGTASLAELLRTVLVYQTSTSERE